jgi:hypothetical protein
MQQLTHLGAHNRGRHDRAAEHSGSRNRGPHDRAAKALGAKHWACTKHEWRRRKQITCARKQRHVQYDCVFFLHGRCYHRKQSRRYPMDQAISRQNTVLPLWLLTAVRKSKADIEAAILFDQQTQEHRLSTDQHELTGVHPGRECWSFRKSEEKLYCNVLDEGCDTPMPISLRSPKNHGTTPFSARNMVCTRSLMLRSTYPCTRHAWVWDSGEI